MGYLQIDVKELLSEPKKTGDGKDKESAGPPIVEKVHGESCDCRCQGERAIGESHLSICKNMQMPNHCPSRKKNLSFETKRELAEAGRSLA